MVVIGHFNNGIAHDIIFLFHMPLFFIISGYLLKREHLTEKNYILNKSKSLMIPYAVYLLIDLFIVRRDCSMNSIVHALWGGRAVQGVYWYVTCFLFTLFLLSIMIKYLSDATVKALILMGGGIAAIESHLIDKIHFLRSPGVPFNLDVTLLALVYVGIGFFYKKQIKQLAEAKSVKYNVISVVTITGLALFCWYVYKDGQRLYYFDMKPVYYKDLLLVILIPCAFGTVLVRLVYWMNSIKWLEGINRFLGLCGQATIPIMFMHVPLNHWKDSIGYGRAVYLLIGIGVPLMITFMCNNISVARRLFGLPKINIKSL